MHFIIVYAILSILKFNLFDVLRLCQLGQMIPWWGSWGLESISDPEDRISEHLIQPDMYDDSSCESAITR